MTSAEISVAEKAREDVRTTTVKQAALRSSCHVAVIGAGPYGLSVGAHLKTANIDTRVFGDAMSFWRWNMPKGMRLRSPWRASHLADSKGELSLDRYVDSHGLERTEQLPREEFVRYGEWFQRKAVPDLDTRKIARVDIAERGFLLRLEDGNLLNAQRVVIAMGFANQSFRPPEFEHLPATMVSHSSEHASFDAFRGRRVVVIGRGQSACESAVLLSEAGAEVELLSRGDVHWIGADTNKADHARGLVRRARELLTAKSAVGPFPLEWLNDAPGIVRHLPLSARQWIATRSLRPAASAWLRPRAGAIRFTAGRKVVSARTKDGQIELKLDDGASSLADHVVVATGYRVDIAKLGILAFPLLDRINRVDGHPLLSAGFESSVPGLHFTGSSAIKSFGPLMRFIAGAGYAARAVVAAALAGRP
jgi:cation diffusion facilitator CzcD-associated flavoprotein CzcO